MFGSPGSGKTTLALAIAGRFAAQKRNVILVSSDKVVPNLRVLLPNVQTDKSFSMGTLLLQPELTQAMVSQKLAFHPQSDCLACTALATGDNPITYPPLFEPKKIIALLRILAGLADEVIVDGTSNPTADSVTLTALEVSARTLCTITPDRKGVEYMPAMLAVLRDEKYRTGEQLRILSPVREVSPVKEIRGLIEDIFSTLPYSPEVEDKFLSGRLLRGFGRRQGLLFEAHLNSIMDELK